MVVDVLGCTIYISKEVLYIFHNNIYNSIKEVQMIQVLLTYWANPFNINRHYGVDYSQKQIMSGKSHIPDTRKWRWLLSIKRMSFERKVDMPLKAQQCILMPTF